MVTNTRTPLRTDRLRPLNSPRNITVVADEHGCPISIPDRSASKHVAEILDTWRVSDEWWRRNISRHYFELLLDDGCHLIVFNDLATNEWFTQGV